MAVHVARIGLVHVNSAGEIKGKDAMTIGEAITSNQEMRVLADTNIPNTAGNPTISAYLELEENDTFELRHLDQTYIITYN